MRILFLGIMMSSIRVFGHYVCVKLILLAIIEFFISAGAIYIATFIRFLGDISAIETNTDLFNLGMLAFIFACIIILDMGAMGLYLPWQRMTILEILLRIAASFLTACLILTCLFYLFPALLLGRGVLIPAIILSFIGICLARVTFYSSIGENSFKRRILLLGTGKKASSFMQLRRRADQRSFYNLGFVKCQGEQSVVDSSKILEVNTPLLDFAKKHRVDEIVVAVDDRRREFPLCDLLDCRMSGIDITDVCTFLERETRRIKLDILQPSWIIFSAGFRQKFLRLFIKRIFDVTSGLFLLLMTWPIMVVTALAILIESNWKGSVLYRQYRVGQDGKIFEILKFRSMCLNAEQDGKAQWAQIRDPRVTRVGTWIRKFRIDELPQLFNILRGDMSLIGPRPERPEFVKELSENIPYYVERHRVKPGLAGWAQLCYSYGASEADALEKLQYDLYYVKNHSLFLDLAILIQTFEIVLFHKGVR